MKTKKFLFYLLAGILAGCLPVISLHPLFTEEAMVFEEKLLGIWMDDINSPGTTWEFKCAADSSEKDRELPREIREKTYLLTFSNDKGQKGSFFAALSASFGRLFLDVCPSRLPCVQSDRSEDRELNSFFFMPGHSFAIIDSIEPKLRMRWIINDGMKKLLEKDPNAVKHEVVEDRIILTASSAELQAFVLEYADDCNVFSAEAILSRSVSKTPSGPNDIDANAVAPPAPAKAGTQ